MLGIPPTCKVNRSSHNTPTLIATPEVVTTVGLETTSMMKTLPSKEGLFSSESSFWADVRKKSERHASPTRIKAALDGKVEHRNIGRGDERETWYIGQILH